MTVSLTQFLLVAALLPICWVLLDAFLSYLKERRIFRQQRKAARSCHLCGNYYPEEKRVKISTCPECDGQNRRGGHRKLG